MLRLGSILPGAPICRRVPPFMLHYANSGYYAEQTLSRNVSDLENIALRQRVHKRYV